MSFDRTSAGDGTSVLPEAPLSAGPPPLFDVTAFSQWVTDVFTDEHDDEILDKLASMDASDDMAKMRLLLNEEANIRRSRLDGEAITKSYSTEEEGAASRDVLMICFAGENDMLVSAPIATQRLQAPPRVWRLVGAACVCGTPLSLAVVRRLVTLAICPASSAPLPALCPWRSPWGGCMITPFTATLMVAAAASRLVCVCA